jgi:hypothetical protein
MQYHYFGPRPVPIERDRHALRLRCISLHRPGVNKFRRWLNGQKFSDDENDLTVGQFITQAVSTSNDQL